MPQKQRDVLLRDDFLVVPRHLAVEDVGLVEHEIGEVRRLVVLCRTERFHEVMAEDSGQSVLPVLESAILPLIPGVIDRLRLGIEVTF